MFRENLDGLRVEQGYKMRCMRSLHKQIKKDYDECHRLWEKLKNGTISIAEKDELSRVTCWLKQGLKLNKDWRKSGIEEITSWKMKSIENELRNVDI